MGLDSVRDEPDPSLGQTGLSLHTVRPSGITQKGLSPGFRAPRLSRREKRGPLWGFSTYFPVFKAKKGPQKNLRQTLVTSDTRVSLVKVLPKLQTEKNYFELISHVIGDHCDWTTRAPYNTWREEVRRRTSLAPLASPCFILSLSNLGTEGPLAFQAGITSSIRWNLCPVIFGVDVIADASTDQESPRQPKPKKGPRRKVHEFCPLLWILVSFSWENEHDSHRTLVQVCPREKFINWPFFGLVCRGDSWTDQKLFWNYLFSGNSCKLLRVRLDFELSAPKSQRFLRFAIAMPTRTPEIARFLRQEPAMMHCDLRVRLKVASDLRFRAAISEPKTPSFCGISGDWLRQRGKSLAIAIVRFWCAKISRVQHNFLREYSKNTKNTRKILRRCFGGVQKFSGRCVFSGTFSSPPFRFAPPISWPKKMCHK